MSDYLAYTVIGAGGSWARDPDPTEAVRRCASIAHSDWGHLYKMDGKELTVGLYDVEGHDRVTMGDRGVWAGDVNIPMLRSEKIRLPVRRR